MLIIAALTLLTATAAPSATEPPKARATVTARAIIIEAARIDFKTATLRIRRDQTRSVDFE